jgi:hypothetical protein
LKGHWWRLIKSIPPLKSIIFFARVQFYLSRRRPVGVKYLNDPQRPREYALKAYLDGNYNELKEYASKNDKKKIA